MVEGKQLAIFCNNTHYNYKLNKCLSASTENHQDQDFYSTFHIKVIKCFTWLDWELRTLELQVGK